MTLILSFKSSFRCCLGLQVALRCPLSVQTSVCASCMAVTLPALSFPLAKTAFVLRCVMLRRVYVFTDDKNETLFVLMGVLSVTHSPSSLYILPSPSAFGRTSISGFHLFPSEAPAHIFASFNIFTNSVSKT